MKNVSFNILGDRSATQRTVVFAKIYVGPKQFAFIYD